MNFKRIIIPLLLILFMASMVAFAVEDYGNVGPTTNFGYDIGISDEIVAEGSTVDEWETTIEFTDPTADNTITVPDADVVLGVALTLTVTDNEATNENNAVLFTSGGALGGGVLGIESDGDFYYNPSDGSLHATLLYGDGTNLTGVGAAAATALTISGKAAENIDKGEVVYISGATGPFAEFSLADNTDAAKHTFCGVAAETKTTGQIILIRVRGELAGFNTSAFADGDLLYLSTAGALTNVKPTSGAIEIVGFVSYDHAAGSIVVMHHSAHGIHVPSTDDIVIRMGDSIAANKVYFKDYANAEVAFVDSDGKADFTSLTLDTALLIAEGGTNSAAALTNDRVMVSSGGAIIHSATITVTELGLLNGRGGILVTDVTECTDLEGTLLSIGGVTLNAAIPEDHINATMLKDDNAPANLDIFTYIAAGTTGHWLSYAEIGIGLATSITDGIIVEADLDADAVAVGDILTYDDGGVDFLWKTKAELNIASSGANTDITSILNAALYVGRDTDNRLNWTTDDNLEIWIGGVEHDIISISDGGANNDKLVTQGYVDDAAAAGGANQALSNLAVVAINLSLVSDAQDTDSLGSATKEWLNLYIGDAGKIYCGLGQDISIHRSAAGVLTLTAANGVVTSAGLTVTGNIGIGANDITLTGAIGRDADNFLGWAVDDSLAIEIGGVAHAIVSITDGDADNDKLCTQGYADDIVAGADVSLSNLAAVAINTSLLPDAHSTWDLGGVADTEWGDLYLGYNGTVYFGTGQTESIAETAVNALLITATDGITFTGEIWTIEVVGIGRDTDNYIGWGVDNSLAIKINGVAHAFVSITTGLGGDDDKLVTQGYVDTVVAGAFATPELDNLGVVALNTSLISDTADTDDLGSATFEFRSIYVGTVGKIYMGLSQEIALEVAAANTLDITATAGIIVDALVIDGALAYGINISGANTTAQLYIGGTDILATGEQAIYINCTGETNATNGIWVTLGSTVVTGDVTGIRSRVTTNAEADGDVPTGQNTRAIYGQAIAAINDDAGLLQGGLFVADVSAGSATVYNVHVLCGHYSAGASTVIGGDIYVGYLRSQTRENNARAVGGHDVILALENEGVQGDGGIIDSAIRIFDTNVVAAGFTYGIDMSGAVIATADIILSNSETISNVTDGIIVVSGTLQLGGDLDLNEYGIDFSDDLGDDHDYSGITDTVTAGENVVFGQILYQKFADDEWYLALADAYATAHGEVIALESKGNGQECLVLRLGYIRDDSAFDFAGSAVFLNDDAGGACDEEAPAESGDQIQIVGTAMTADIMYFNPSQDIGEI